MNEQVREDIIWSLPRLTNILPKPNTQNERTTKQRRESPGGGLPAFCLLGFVAKTHKIPNIMIEQLLNQAVETALIELESIARTILLENNDLHEFVMSMGCWSFTNNDGKIVDADDERLKPIAAMIGKWDDSLKLTGEPMRFTAGGPKITAWW